MSNQVDIASISAQSSASKSSNESSRGPSARHQLALAQFRDDAKLQKTIKLMSTLEEKSAYSS